MFRGPGAFPSIDSESIVAMGTPIAAANATARAREGKFTNLNAFLSGDEDGLNRISHYVPASQAELAPGHIVHIKDNKQGTETRIHDRVMLVIKNNAPVSMVCYAFCKHDPPLASTSDAQTHWLVCPSEEPPQTENPGCLPLLEVVLHYKLSPKSDITINLRDPWNVEYEVEVAKLGVVPVKFYEAVRRRINHIFVAESYNSPLVPLIINTAPQSADTPGSSDMMRSRSAGNANQGNPTSPRLRTVQLRRPSESQRISGPFLWR